MTAAHYSSTAGSTFEIARRLAKWTSILLSNTTATVSSGYGSESLGARKDEPVDAKNSDVGILLVSQENQTSPIMTSQLATLDHDNRKIVIVRVNVPLCELAAPFDRFNSVSLDRVGIFALIQAINTAKGGPLNPPGQVDTLLKQHYAEMEGELAPALHRETETEHLFTRARDSSDDRSSMAEATLNLMARYVPGAPFKIVPLAEWRALIRALDILTRYFLAFRKPTADSNPKDHVVPLAAFLNMFQLFLAPGRTAPHIEPKPAKDDALTRKLLQTHELDATPQQFR